MPSLPDRLMLITATVMEAEPLTQRLDRSEPLDLPLGTGVRGSAFGRRFDLVHLGVGKVNTAAGLALAVHTLHPQAVIQFGIGGSYLGSFTSIGMVLAAREEVHIDCGLNAEDGWRGMEALGFPLIESEPPMYNQLPTDAPLTATIAGPLELPTAVFGTSETVTGTFDESQALQKRFDLSIESMEGAAAAQVCLALDLPFSELRAVSNIVGEPDRSAWNVPAAVRAVNEAMVAILQSDGEG